MGSSCVAPIGPANDDVISEDAYARLGQPVGVELAVVSALHAQGLEIAWPCTSMYTYHIIYVYISYTTVNCVMLYDMLVYCMPVCLSLLIVCARTQRAHLSSSSSLAVVPPQRDSRQCLDYGHHQMLVCADLSLPNLRLFAAAS